MRLKDIVLESVSHDCLKRLSCSFDATPGDSRSKASIREAIKETPNLKAEDLLRKLMVEELKDLCRKCDIPPRGRRAEMISLLLERDRGATRKTSTAEAIHQPKNTDCFVAVDFETADHPRDSACALALVTVKGDRIFERSYFLIRPPRKTFTFTMHGITWAKVADAPTFGELWPYILPRIDQAAFLVAHNAGFDRSVFRACCNAYSLILPDIQFECTKERARKVWNLASYKLPDVCRFLNIPLENHHNALDDAEACAKIMIRLNTNESGADL